MVYPSLCRSSGSSGECVGIAHYTPEQLRKPKARWQQKLPPLFFRKQPHHEMVQSDLLIPGDARDQMLDHMARLPPRPATYQQSRETRAETSRAAPVFQGHQVVLRELPHAIKVETYVRQQQEHDEHKQPSA